MDNKPNVNLIQSAGSAASSLTCPAGAVAPHQPPYDLRRKIYYLTSLGPNWAAAAPRKRQRRTGSSSPEEPLCLDSALMSLEPVLPTSASVGSSSPLGQNEASMEGEQCESSFWLNKGRCACALQAHAQWHL